MTPKNGLLLDRLGIKNFRSFDDDGIYLENLSKINLFIGKNNSGKSNIVKLFQILWSLGNHNNNFLNFPDTLENQHNRNNKNASFFFRYEHEELGFPKTYRVTYEISGSKGGYDRSISDILKNPITLSQTFKDNTFELKKEIVEKYHHEDDLIRSILIHKNISEVGYTLWEAMEQHYKLSNKKFLENVLAKVVYIPDFRLVQEGSNIVSYNSKINGANIISQLFQMQNPNLGEEENKKKLNIIEETLKELLGVNELSLQIPHTKDKIFVVINGKRLALENLGTGISEIVLLCCALLVHENCLVCIEEPEIHLHPELQRKFFQFLFKTKNQYLITTHSNIFLDNSHEDVSIYHVKHDGEKSIIKYCENESNAFEVIEDLGYKASDLLQANGIIWVEGPSDRTYINKWINLLDSNLKEGIHYTIMFYGGKLLSHLTLSNNDLFFEQEFIQLLRINRNAFVIMDRDGIADKINKTKTRICEEIGNENFWVTKGREIENYLSMGIINKWCTSKKMTLISSEIKDENKFDEIIVEYAKSKSSYSKQIADFFSIEDINKSDLKKQIKKITSNIKKWNS